MKDVIILFMCLLVWLLWVRLVLKVPARRHGAILTSLNALSGVMVVGAMLPVEYQTFNVHWVNFGAVAVFLATSNIVGGYIYTDRWLRAGEHKTGKR